jgi:Zn-finger nucleic acid-binding protein
MPVKPSSKEDEYFSRLDLEKRKKVEEEKHKKVAEEERSRLKQLHFMRCPKCGMELSEIDHKGISVDKCFHCDGIWLDAGEIDSIVKLEKGAMTKLFHVFKK